MRMDFDEPVYITVEGKRVPLDVLDVVPDATEDTSTPKPKRKKIKPSTKQETPKE